MNRENEKYLRYAVLVTEKIGELLQDDLQSELEDDTLDLTQFFHALSTVAPTRMFNEMTGDSQDNLGYNQLMNRLCFQFGTKSKDS